MNRGRFQAQGGGLEESRAWNVETVPTKEEGKGYIKELKDKLAPAEVQIRQSCFEKAEKWVDEAPRNGYVVVTIIKTSFKPYPPIKDIRVDGELYSGAAFKNHEG